MVWRLESIADRFLSAAVKLDRKPFKCVVFEDDPRGITAAHNCTMMAVALIGAHPAYFSLELFFIWHLLSQYWQMKILLCCRLLHFLYQNGNHQFNLKSRYDLGQADLAVANFNELSVINLWRRFSNKGSTFMDLQKQVIEKTPFRRKLTIDTY